MYNFLDGMRKMVLISFTGVVCSLIIIAYHVFQQRLGPTLPTTLISTPLDQMRNTPQNLSIGPPVRIIIPKINVNAVLEYVGLTPEGEMDQPTEAHNAAWLNRRPLPGEVGTSVIAGHFGFEDKRPAVFDNLHKLRKGDKIYIKDNKGAIAVFVVKEHRNYTPEQDAAEVFGSSDGKSHLNLITCKGAWDESLQSYDTRLVVFTDRMDDVTTDL